MNMCEKSCFGKRVYTKGDAITHCSFHGKMFLGFALFLCCFVLFPLGRSQGQRGREMTVQDVNFTKNQ